MRLRWQLAFASSLWLAPCVHALAQQPDAPQTPYVLHVYANLVQVPALVLGSNFKPVPPLTREQFSLRLDSGPAFRPTKMHIEGDEPLSLAILLDASGDQDRLVRPFAAALAQLAQTSLKPQDRITVFAVDCHLIRSALNLPPDPDAVGSAVDRALAAPTLHNGKDRGACGRSLRTWDAAAHVVGTLSNLPGRRVLLLVSTGDDRKSANTIADLRHYAAEKSVAVFAVRDLVHFEGDYGSSLVRPDTAEINLGLAARTEDLFTELCESNGGLIVTLTQDKLALGLQQIVAMLRGRYILEFPRPNNDDPGEHSIDVTTPSRDTFIVTAGVSVPLPNEDLATDPNTVPSTPSPAVLGKRRPLSTNH